MTGKNSTGLVIFHKSRFALDERILITLFLVISIPVSRSGPKKCAAGTRFKNRVLTKKQIYSNQRILNAHEPRDMVYIKWFHYNSRFDQKTIV